MSLTNGNDLNPYAPPTVDTSIADPTASDLGPISKTLGVFHSQVQILGAFWVCSGIVCLLVCATAAQLLNIHINGRPQYNIQAILYGASGVLWLLSGAMSYCKQIWAVYLGLGMSYLFLVASVLMFGLLFGALFLLAIILSHRVLGWAKQLSNAGIPLTTRPDEPKFPLPD